MTEADQDAGPRPAISSVCSAGELCLFEIRRAQSLAHQEALDASIIERGTSFPKWYNQLRTFDFSVLLILQGIL
jgi:hypothetical protein